MVEEEEKSVLVRFAEWVLEVDKVVKFTDDQTLWIDCKDEIDLAVVAYVDEEGDLILSDDYKNSEGADYLFTF